MKAGFDGVHIHGAKRLSAGTSFAGSTNQRSDDYGGGIENRARLSLEVPDACIDVWGAARVGMASGARMEAMTGDSVV